MRDTDGVAAAPRPPVQWRTRVLIRLGTALLVLLGRSWRVRILGRDALMARQPDDPRVVYTLWHGQMLPILWGHRQPTGVLISEHRDGEIIARIVARFGFFGIRGSTSRGGARALLECVRTLRDGADVAITPDGPRGPRHSFASGALVVAFRAKTSIVPIVANVSRKWTLGSWDGFEIPKPFARVTVLYGAPVPVDVADVREASLRTDEFVQVMRDNLERVAMLAAAS